MDRWIIYSKIKIIFRKIELLQPVKTGTNKNMSMYIVMFTPAHSNKKSLLTPKILPSQDNK
jgi:hypothetical protein